MTHVTSALSHLSAATACLSQFNEFMQKVGLPAISRGSLPDACRSYKAIRDAYEVMDEHRKKLHEILEGINRDTLPTMMEDQKAPSIKVECEGHVYFRFVRSQRMSASMVDKEGGMGWLREIGAGGMIQETVNAQTLGAFVKKRIQDEGLDVPAEYFKISTMNVVSVTKA